MAVEHLAAIEGEESCHANRLQESDVSFCCGTHVFPLTSLSTVEGPSELPSLHIVPFLISHH
jgi:hypothetical protein